MKTTEMYEKSDKKHSTTSSSPPPLTRQNTPLSDDNPKSRTQITPSSRG